MREGGHDVEVVIREGKEVIRMLKRVILADIMLQNKSNGKLMTKKEKVDFIIKWEKQSKNMLEDGGLGPKKGDAYFPQLKISYLF
jgi:hypothetical protein